MGTRSTTTVYDGEVPILSLYRQYDGYPSCHGQALEDFLAGGKMTNGIYTSDDGTPRFNGAGDLAVRLVTHLKGNANEPGQFYAIPPDQAGEEEYHYDVLVGPEGSEPHVRVKSCGNLLAQGPATGIVAAAQAAEADDD